MKALAAYRHHPMAYLALLALALVTMGAAYAVLAPRDAGAEVATAEDIAQGKNLFLANCATCHGVNGQGRVDGEGNTLGPSLIGVGAAAVDFQVGTGRMPMQMEGPQAQVKPPQFDDKQISQLSAYVATLGPGPAIPDAKYTTPDGDAARGGELFRVNCAMCHNAAGAGGALTHGKYAPPLLHVKGKHVYEAMETGPQNMPVFSDDNMTPQDKHDIITYLHTLKENGSPGGWSLGSLGPVTEGLYAWTIGLAMLLGCAFWLGAKSK